MNETINESKSENIMQDIQAMITGLLTNAVDKMQGDAESPGNEISPDVGLDDIKSFVDVMQKFIDNIKLMVVQLEGNTGAENTDDKLLDGYMATADNVLELANFSMKDALTGLSNRYGFDNRIVLEWNRATREKTALGLVIFAPDGLEKCETNEKREEIIKEVSKSLVSSGKRSTDFVARWSDNEFAVLLPVTDPNGINTVVERLRTEIEKIDSANLLTVNGKKSISMGVYVYTPEPGKEPTEFISKTYSAYTKAKESGGNAVNIV